MSFLCFVLRSINDQMKAAGWCRKQMVIFGDIAAKNTTRYRRFSSLSDNVQIQWPPFIPRCHHELCLDRNLKSYRGRAPGNTAGHSPTDLSTFHVIIQVCTGRRQGSGYSGLPIHQGNEERERERWCLGHDKYQREPNINRNKSEDPKATVLKHTGKEKNMIKVEGNERAVR